MQKQFNNVEDIQIQLADVPTQEIQIEASALCKIHIQAGNRVRSDVLITYTGKSAHIDCTIELARDANINILFYNDLHGEGSFVYQIHLQEDAHAYVGIGDLHAYKSTYTLTSKLNKSGSKLHIRSACIAHEKIMEMDITHVVAHTSALMENFAIVKEHGKYHMHASGIIQKGAHDSTSHQATRVLTLAQNQKSEVIPVLLIDENEVKASHATTLGQPDEDQLYYLCSRGLSRSAAIALLSTGYIMPICEVVSDLELQKRLRHMIEEKVILND